MEVLLPKNSFFMKKILIMLPLLLLLTGCFGNSSNVDEAKKELGVTETNTTSSQAIWETPNQNETTPTLFQEDEIVELDKSYTLEYLGDNKFLKLDSLDDENFYDGQVELTGTTLTQVDKIVVSFENKDSSYPKDIYTLQSFNPGDAQFIYRAFDSYKTLDFGTNIYEITAYSGEQISKLLLTISLNQAGQEEAKADIISYEKQLLGPEDNSSVISLPQGAEFGNIVLLGEDSFTYSKINGLEIKKQNWDFRTSCAGLTDYLSNTLDSNWFYWNTCRDIIYKAWEENQKAISFYVVSLQEETYTYTKHYLDFKNSLYGTYTIKSWDWIAGDDTNTQLGALNTQLKEKNDSFSEAAIVDALFQDIVR